MGGAFVIALVAGLAAVFLRRRRLASPLLQMTRLDD